MRLPLVNRIPAAILAALAVMILATAQADAQHARHDVEVRKDGFATFRRTVDVRAEETVSLNVSLSR